MHTFNKTFKIKINKQSGFGVLFDIDGVLLRGHTPIPQASAAIKKLMNAECDEFTVPTLFCTNAFGLKKVKAEILSNALGVKVSFVFIIKFGSKVSIY